jgi:hypothetical protein
MVTSAQGYLTENTTELNLSEPHIDRSCGESIREEILKKIKIKNKKPQLD